MDIHEKKLTLEDTDLLALLGYKDNHLNMIDNHFDSIITVRGNSVTIKGASEEVKALEKVFDELIYMIKKNGSINENDIETVINLVSSDKLHKNDKRAKSEKIIFWGSDEVIRARTPRQTDYLSKVKQNDIVFSIGPAGTGKTFLAVAMAVAALKRNEVRKIILSRPAVEAGESLGFLPGDLKEKLDPYLKPLTDALYHMLNAEKLNSMLEKNVIEIIPLAYMRGRTLSNAFIILDEAQNATITQMKMFLTRLGENSKAIVTGDITQIDLVRKKESGLVHAKSILNSIPGIDFIYFTTKDVVRHRLVAEIIKAYERDENKNINVQPEKS